MISIAGNNDFPFETNNLSELERNIYQNKKSSSYPYHYKSVENLLFELTVRSHIVEYAKSLSESGAQFADFEHSKCNEAFWDRDHKGGFQLKKGVSPHDAINDIFINGGLYAFECATAMVIVLFKAIMESIGTKQFDILFPDILLYDWHLDSDIRLLDRTHPEDAVAGDILYIKNPDFDPEFPWWRGENVIKLEQDSLYGHGIGISTAEEIIKELNSSRITGSTVSASLSDRYDELDFSYLWQLSSNNRGAFFTAKIGTKTYII
ncbi:Protein-glutamine gamma-glutamyltransferase [compost metagenome]